MTKTTEKVLMVLIGIVVISIIVDVVNILSDDSGRSWSKSRIKAYAHINSICNDNVKTFEFRQGGFSWDWDITITCTDAIKKGVEE